jgi:hypothetical protein
MGKKLAKDVHVGGEVYSAGSEIADADVAKKITNPKAWAEEDQADDGDAKKPAASRSSTAKK